MKKKTLRGGRRRILSILLTGLLLAGASPVCADASSSSEEASDGLVFTNEQLVEMGTPIHLGEYTWSKKATAYFSDPESKYALSGIDGAAGCNFFWDREGNPHEITDVIGEEYHHVAPFFEGLAAVVKYNPDASLDMRWTVGYVNEAGEEVIPCIYNVIPNSFSQDYFTSRFKNGYAYVYKSSGINGYHDIRGSIAKIDKTGKIVEDWVDYGTFINYDIRSNIDNEPIFRQLQLVSGVFSGFHDYSTDYFELTNSGDGNMGKIVTSYPATADVIVTSVYQQNASEPTAVLIDRAKLGGKPPHPDTRYQSTAELTNIYIAELDYSNFVLTITNPTDGYDSGTVALVLASDMATVHFVDYALGPKASKSYNLTVPGHIGVGANKSMVILGSGWGAYLNADIITFESDADRDAYRSAVVYEENMDGLVSQGTKTNAHVVICNGQPGDNWLKNYTGIGRHDRPYLDPALSHDICK